MSMNGYFARWILCSGTTSVDFGLYSSMVGVCWDAEPCCVLAARGHSKSADQMHKSIAGKTETARQDFIAAPRRKPPNSFSQERELQPHSFTQHHSSLHGSRDICRAEPSGCTMKLSEKFDPMPCSGSYKPGSTENAMPGSSMV